MKRAWFRFPRLLDYEVYKYKSNKSPYLSQFVGAESCIPVLIKVEKLVRFCLGTYAKVLSEKNTSSKESNVTLFNESELDVMKNEMGTMKGEMDEMKRKMRLFSKLRETIQRGIKSPQDIKRLKFLLVAAGHKLHGKKVSTDIKKKIGKNVRKKVKTRGQKNTIGINNLSLVDIMKSMFKEYEDGTAHTGCVDERTGISIEGLEESLLGEKVDNAITITQMFGDWSASVNQEDVLSAINTIREFDSQDIYLK